MVYDMIVDMRNDPWGWGIWWDNGIGNVHLLTNKRFAYWNFESTKWGLQVKNKKFKFFTI